MLWFWIILIVLIVMTAFLASWIHIHVHVQKSNQVDLIELKVKAIFGLLRMRFNIPAIWAKQIKKQKEEDSLKKSAPESGMLMQHIKGLFRWLKKTLWHVRCTRLEWSTRIGFADASQTAILTGAILGMKWTVSGIAARFIQLHTEPKLFVTPEYKYSTIDTELQCIVKIRFGYAIVAGIQFLIRIAKVKGGFRTWKNTLFKV